MPLVVIADDTDRSASSITCPTLECSCSADFALWIPEPSRIAMSTVCAHVNVTHSRHEFGALDTIPSASSRTVLGSRDYLESLTFDASMGWDFDLDFCYWSADVRYVHYDYCKTILSKQSAISY